MCNLRALVVAALLLHSVVALVSAQRSSQWKTLSGDAPKVVARGGFSGLFPGFSSAAFNLALITSVPDVILWCDVQLTKDGAGICFPDLLLNNNSNINEVLPQKEKTYLVNGVSTKGWFTVDYTWDGLVNVSVTQGIYSRSNRFDGNLYPILLVEDVATQFKPPGLWLNIQSVLLTLQVMLQDKPLVISKYGASGDFPSCTDLAYTKAIADGVDVLDCPVQISKDGIPFCASSINLIDSTTVAQSSFSNLTTVVPEIKAGSGIYTFSLAWKDIEGLTTTISNPSSKYTLFRNPRFKTGGKYLTLSDFLALAKKSSSLSGVLIGIEVATKITGHTLATNIWCLIVAENPCLRQKEIPSYMSPIPPASLVQVITPSYLPPAEAPNPVLTESDVIEPPLPSVTAVAPAPTGGSTVGVSPRPSVSTTKVHADDGATSISHVHFFRVQLNRQKMIFNVKKYGGVADGKTDNSKAFIDAWTQACQNNGGGVVLFPAGKYLVKPVVFTGGCKGPMVVQIKGTLLAPVEVKSSIDINHWITFQYVDNLVINGGGSLDGQGPSAWPYNNCMNDPHCKRLPTTLRLDFVTNSKIHDITSINSKNVHINLFASHDITIQNITISAPGDSPNTDGIHIGTSHHIEILDSVIATGDDCISFSSGSNNIKISGVHCGPGHGISIGSLGKGAGDDVSFVDIRNCTFVGTTNGVRVKTWAPSQPGTVSHLTVENVRVDKVDNPIIIDQQYCPSRSCSTTESSRVQIQDVKFSNIWGSSTTQSAITLKCSQTNPCQKIEMRDINLVYNGPEGSAHSACTNADVVTYGQQQPLPCTEKIELLYPSIFD
ncbi:unnamed protein product [Malus baccata var. baccata]